MKLDDLEVPDESADEEEDTSDFEEDLTESLSLLGDCWTELNNVLFQNGHRRRGLSFEQEKSIIGLMVEVQAFLDNFSDLDEDVLDKLEGGR